MPARARWGAPPLVVGVITAEDTLRRFHRGPAPFHVAEFRLDLLGGDPCDLLARARTILPDRVAFLATIRSAAEGGRWRASEEERLALYRTVMPLVDAVDVELSAPILPAVVASARADGRRVVGSFHDFAGMPADSDLRARIQAGVLAGVDVIKLAVTVSVPGEMDRLRALLRDAGHTALCLLGMGPLGPLSRTELPRAGSCLTYGFADASCAPGQVPVEDLWAAFGAATPAG